MGPEMIESLAADRWPEDLFQIMISSFSSRNNFGEPGMRFMKQIRPIELSKLYTMRNLLLNARLDKENVMFNEDTHI